jgi:hypothetical protein
MAGRRSPWRRLAPCVALTIAAHAAVLAVPVRPAGIAGAVSPVATIQWRTIEARPVVPPPMEVAAPPAAAAVPAVQAPRARTQAPPLAAPDSTVPTSAREAPTEATLTPPVYGWSLPGVADDDDVFLARSFLAVAPAPLAPVIIQYPEFAAANERYSGELTLYIDETGAVVRVRAETGALPPALEAAAREAFMSVRFRPGELAEHGAVKSRIRVEVTFEGGAPMLLG